MAPAAMMMLSDMADEDMLEKTTKSSYELHKEDYSNFSDDLVDY
jgi:hypothetical protein